MLKKLKNNTVQIHKKTKNKLSGALRLLATNILAIVNRDKIGLMHSKKM